MKDTYKTFYNIPHNHGHKPCAYTTSQGFLSQQAKMFWQGSVILANAVWLHVNSCCKGAVACLYQQGGITGKMLCHLTGGPRTGWAYKREGL